MTSSDSPRGPRVATHVLLVLALALSGVALLPQAAAATYECSFNGDAGECTFYCDAGVKIHMTSYSGVSGEYPRTHATCGGVDEYCQAHMQCARDSTYSTTSAGVGRCYTETVNNAGSCRAEYNGSSGYECSFEGDSSSCTFKCDAGQTIEISAYSGVSGEYPRTHVNCGGVDFHCQQHMSCTGSGGPTSYGGVGTCSSETVRNSGSCRAVGSSTPACGAPGARLFPDNQDGPAPYFAVFEVGGTPASGCSISSYVLDFGDGQSESGAGAPPTSSTHTYSNPGTYTPTLTVTQSDNQQTSDSVTVTVASPPPAGLQNDHFANALTAGFSQSADTASATLETGEPRPCGSIGKTVWYKFTPSQRASVTIDTIDPSTNFDTVLAAYHGSSLSSLTNVACNDDASGVQSQISFTAEAGTTYHVQVGGYGGASGTFVMEVRAVAEVSGPPNPPQMPIVSAPAPTQVHLTWLAPSGDGGSAITGYRIYAGTSATNLLYLTSVGASTFSHGMSDLAPREHFFQVAAVNANGESARSEMVSVRAYDLYEVELRAWIPHAQVVDPAYPSPSSYNPFQTCNAGLHQSTHWSFKGDDHVGFDGSFRVRSMLTFKWDGLYVREATEPAGEKFGVTQRLHRYEGYTGALTAPCVYDQKQVDYSSSIYVQNAYFQMSYASPNPFFGTPDIDGTLDGWFDEYGVLQLQYRTDQFPSHAFKVVRNGVAQLTVTSTDASCLSASAVMGAGGATTLFDGLTSSQPERRTPVPTTDVGRVESYPSGKC